MHQLTEIRVRGYHADFYGHVNNARYLEFFEEDRWASFESNFDLPKWLKKGLVFMVVNININYRKAVPVGAVIQVSTDLGKIGNNSVTLQQKAVFKDSGKVAADALVTFVIADHTGQSIPIEGDVYDEIMGLKLST